MEKINKYKYQIIAVFLAIAFIVFYNWNSNNLLKLEGERNILKKQYTEQRQSLIKLEEKRKREKDSLNKTIALRQEENARLRDVNSNLQNRIAEVVNRPIKIPTDVKTSVEYYNNKYVTTDNKVVEDKVGLSLSTSNLVITDLEQGEKSKEIIFLKDDQLLNKETEITNLNKDKKDLYTLLTSAEETVTAKDNLQKSAEENIKNLEGQNKKLRTKSFLNKFLVPISFVVGGIVGTQIAK